MCDRREGSLKELEEGGTAEVLRFKLKLVLISEAAVSFPTISVQILLDFRHLKHPVTYTVLVLLTSLPSDAWFETFKHISLSIMNHPHVSSSSKVFMTLFKRVHCGYDYYATYL